MATGHVLLHHSISYHLIHCFFLAMGGHATCLVKPSCCHQKPDLSVGEGGSRRWLLFHLGGAEDLDLLHITTSPCDWVQLFFP